MSFIKNILISFLLVLFLPVLVSAATVNCDTQCKDQFSVSFSGECRAGASGGDLRVIGDKIVTEYCIICSFRKVYSVPTL